MEYEIVYQDIEDLYESVVFRRGPFNDMQNVKDLAETCLKLLVERGYEISGINCDGTFNATKTEVI